MLPLDDPRWSKLTGGYRVAYNAAPALKRMERGEDVWSELWNELHHQGDLGEASYAAVPHLVRIAREASERRVDFYSLAATIESERTRQGNPPVPS